MTRPRIVDAGANLALCRRTTRRHFLLNDNQVGTARHFSRFGLFEIVESESEISARMNQMLANLDRYRTASYKFAVADSLIEAIRRYVGC